MMLILVFLAGFLILSRLSLGTSMLERIGFALPIGLSAITLIMALMDWVCIPLCATSLTIVTVLAAIVPAALLWPKRREFAGQFKPRAVRMDWANAVWILALIAVAYLEYVNISKCLFYPTYDRDSMAAFDTIGYVCAQEHTFHYMSIFEADYFPKMHEAGSSMSYIPMVQLAYAYVYSFGAETSKAVPAFFYLSFLVGFYGLCRRRLTHTASAITLLGILITPEMTSFASLSGTNVMLACVASAGVVYTCLWTASGRRADLWMATLLLAAANWIRLEGIVFIGVAIVIVGIHSVRKREYRSVLIPLAALLPLIVWTLYSHSCGLTTDSAVIAHPYWDADKASSIAAGAWALTTSQSFYGWTFYAALLALIASLWFVVKRQDNLYLPLAIAMGIVCYFLVLYQVDYKWDSVENVLAYSAKRFMFCFVPMAWYYTLAAYPVRRLFEWVEQRCGLGTIMPKRD